MIVAIILFFALAGAGIWYFFFNSTECPACTATVSGPAANPLTAAFTFNTSTYGGTLKVTSPASGYILFVNPSTVEPVRMFTITSSNIEVTGLSTNTKYVVLIVSTDYRVVGMQSFTTGTSPSAPPTPAGPSGPRGPSGPAPSPTPSGPMGPTPA